VPPFTYIAYVAPPTKHGLDAYNVVERLSGYLDRLFAGAERATERMKDRMADRVAERVTDKVVARIADLDARIATLEVLGDEEALDDLRAASEDSAEDLGDYDEIRREVGLA
jgi:hypothetical protein